MALLRAAAYASTLFTVRTVNSAVRTHEEVDMANGGHPKPKPKPQAPTKPKPSGQK